MINTFANSSFCKLFFALILLPLSIKSSIAFTENKGQITDQNRSKNAAVLFSASDSKLVYHFYNDHVSYQFHRVKDWMSVETDKNKTITQLPNTYEIYRLDINWVNCNQSPLVKANNASKDYTNFYLGITNGVTNVKSYKSIKYTNIYNGIDLLWYEKDGLLKYDFIIAPNSDYHQIKMKYDGAENLYVDSGGSLVVETPFGNITEEAPFVTQNNKQIKARWVINHNEVTIDLDDFDSSLEIVIDPAVRVWGTYYGATGSEIGNSSSTDSFFNVYLAGYSTATSTVIATVGAHKTTFSGGGADGFLVKFDGAGNRLWATYYGGTGLELIYSCSVDQSTDDVYMAGQTSTNSGTLIASPGSHQTAYGLGSSDAFLVKFNSLGILQWGTYYGGSGADIGYSCATDFSGNVYLAGNSNSSVANIISTAGGHQVTNGGSVDAFLVKFNSSGVRQWGTYYGGVGLEDGYSCATDIPGNVFLCIASTSTVSTLASVGAHQTVAGGGAGASDVILIKFNTSGTRLWATFIGGSVSERAYSCCTDFSGNVCIAGHAFSTPSTIVATAGSHQSVAGGLNDAFLVKFNSAGVRQWGTFYGAANNDYGYSCSSDGNGNFYLAGYVDGNHAFVATGSGHQTSFGGGVFDIFLAQFDAAGVRQIATFYGGSNNETNPFVTVDGLGSAYLGGQTNSPNNISTIISHQPAAGGGLDAFLAKFTPQLVPLPIYLVSFESVCHQNQEWLKWKTYSEDGNISYTIEGSLDALSWQDIATIPIDLSDRSIKEYEFELPETDKLYFRLRSNEADDNFSYSDLISSTNCKNQLSNPISVFPNPVSSKLSFISDADQPLEITIIDAYGKIVYQSKSFSKSKAINDINVESLAKGFYTITFNNGHSIQNSKFIKQN